MFELKNDEPVGSLKNYASNALQNLLNMTAEHLYERKQAYNKMSGLRAMPGMTQEKAQLLSSLPDSLLGPMLKQLGQQGQDQEMLRQINSVMGGGQLPSGEQALQGQQQPLTQLSPRNAIEISKLQLKKQALEQQKEIRNEASTQKYREKLSEDALRAPQDELRWTNIIKAAQSGQIRAGNKQAIMEKFGIQNFFRDPSTEQAQAEIARLNLGVARAFGPGMGRIMQSEFQAHQEGLVKAWNTPQGMVAIGMNRMLESKIPVILNDAKRQVIRDNKGKVPKDLTDKVEEKATPQLRKLLKRMNKNFELALANKMPDWESARFNPTSYEEGTEAKYKGVTWRIEDGIWVPITGE